MAGWMSVTEAMVLTKLSSPELSALKGAATEATQTELLAEVVSQVVEEARGYIQSNAANRLGAAGTIPERLLIAVLSRIRYELATRLPVKSLLTEERVAANRAAVRLFEQVAENKFAVEDPARAEQSSRISISIASGGQTPALSRDSLRGL